MHESSGKKYALQVKVLERLFTSSCLCQSGASNIQPLESVYSQPHINWTISDENMQLWRPGTDETSGDSWEYLDLLNADHVGGEKGEVRLHVPHICSTASGCVA